MSTATDVVKALKKKAFDVSMLSDDDSPCVVKEWMSTGCAVLDAIIGEGIPIGRITEIYGDNSSGKSLIASQIAATAQEDGFIVAYVDTETAVSREMMEMLGVNVSELLYYSPDTIEEVFNFFEHCVEEKSNISKDSPMLLVWDSVAATSARFEMESDYGKATMGRHAALISQGLRKFTRIISKEHVAMLLINQTRQKIGVMFGDDVTTFGGKAVSFHASVRVQLDVTRKISIPAKRGKKVIGMTTRATVVKNKVSMPFRVAMLPIYFGHGIDDALAAFHYLDDNDIIKTNGGWRLLDTGAGEIKFQKPDWNKIYDENYDAITDIIFDHAAQDTMGMEETVE